MDSKGDPSMKPGYCLPKSTADVWKPSAPRWSYLVSGGGGWKVVRNRSAVNNGMFTC